MKNGNWNLRPVSPQLSQIVIPNEVRDLQLAATCRSLTSFGMTKLSDLRVEERTLP
jgi:hypothetical protein